MWVSVFLSRLQEAVLQHEVDVIAMNALLSPQTAFLSASAYKHLSFSTGRKNCRVDKLRASSDERDFLRAPSSPGSHFSWFQKKL